MAKITPRTTFPFRRRREKRTDYRQRLALLKSGKPRFVVRRAHNYIHVQLVTYTPTGDQTVLEEISRNLRKFGWKAHCGSLPAAYLTGLMAGYKALKAGMTEAVLDLGLQLATAQNAIMAACKGALDAGMHIPVSEEMLPAKSRIEGQHIAAWAAKLSSENYATYQKQFSMYIKNNVDPAMIPQYFLEVKSKIDAELKG